MIGRIILCVILLLLALLTFLLLIPAGIRFTYERGEAALYVRYGPVQRRIPSQKERPENSKPKSKKSKKEKKARKSGAGKGKETKKKSGMNREQLLYSLETLPPILGRALRGVGRGVRLDPLKVHILVAGADPADTALLYGKLEAALAALVPAAERLVRIRRQDIRLFVDFLEDKPDLIAEVGISLRPWTAAAIALRSGVGLAGWFTRFKKLASLETHEDGADMGAEAKSLTIGRNERSPDGR